MLGLSVNEVMHRGGKFHTLKNHEYVFAYESSICALFCACNFFLLPCLVSLTSKRYRDQERWVNSVISAACGRHEQFDCMT